MNKCCEDLLCEIKEMMSLRCKAYSANHQWAKRLAVAFMWEDIDMKYLMTLDIDERE
jgi:hypothetical protein